MKSEYDMSKAKRGAVVSTHGKTRITLYLDNHVLQHYRKKAEKQGKGYQTLINNALHESIKYKRVDSIGTLRHVIREELAKYKISGDDEDDKK